MFANANDSIPERAASGYQPLVVLLAAMCAGIVADRYTTILFGVEMVVAATAWSAWVAACVLRRPRTAALLLLVVAASLGGAWHHAQWRLFDVDDLATCASAAARPVVVEAVLVDAPRVVEHDSLYSPTGSEFRTRFTIDALAVRDGAAWRRAVGRVDVEVGDRVDAVAAGDRVRLYGNVFRAQPPLNPGEFDFAAHYRAERKLCVLRVASAASVAVIERRSTWDIAARFASWRRRGHERLLASVPEEQAGFASALLLGYRDQLDRRENLAFFKTGTIHILSISGLHIGMLAFFLNAALRIGWMRQSAAILVTMFVTTAYVVVIDADPPAVRAALTIVLFAAATLLARKSLDANLLAGAALVVLAQNPSDLFRAGPQLSFLAAAVLMWSARLPLPQANGDPVEQIIRQQSRLRELARKTTIGILPALLVSGAIFTVAAPLVAEKFHIVSPISLLLTPLLALPVAIALAAGFLTLTLGAVVPPLAIPFGYVCGGCLWLTQWLVHAAERVPYGCFWIPGPQAWQVAVCYAMAVPYFALPRGSRWRKTVAEATIFWCVWSMVPSHMLPRDVATRVTFISVGHGLSVLVEDRNGAWLYDCGRFGAAERGAQSIAGVLWTRGLRHLDGIVISHTDADHYNALPFLIEQFGIDAVYVSSVTFGSPTVAADVIRNSASRASAHFGQLAAGDVFRFADDETSCRVLHPPPAGVGGSDNANSVVLDLESHGRRILLTGDLETPGLERLLAKPPLDVDVLLAPHHGSTRSNPPGFARWSTPEFVIISGEEDRRGLVRQAFEAAGAKVVCTTRDGAVTVDIHRDGSMHVTTFRQ